MTLRLLSIVSVTATFGFMNGAFAQVPQSKTAACSQAVDPYLPANSGFKNLCEVSQRYQALKVELKAKGIDAERIPEIRGPRFINPTDWNAKKVEKNFDPRAIYGARKTLEDTMKSEYESWDTTAIGLEKLAQANLSKGVSPVIDASLLVKVNSDTTGEFSPFAGRFRFFEEFGRANTPGLEMSLEETQAFRRVEYTARGTKNNGTPLLRFKYTKCFHTWSKEKQAPYADRTARLSGFEYGDEINLEDYQGSRLADVTVQRNGKTYYCGVLQYPTPTRTDAKLSPDQEREAVNLMEEVQAYASEITSIAKGTSLSSSNILPLASRAQRWLVTLHPFGMGNGRTSRLMMDYLLLSQGLPTPILADHNQDFAHTEESWAKEIGTGLVRTINAMQACVNDPNQKGCQ